MYKIVGADRKEYGPVGADVIRDWIRQGRANGQTQVQAEGGAWQPLGLFPEFAEALKSAPASGLPPVGLGYNAPAPHIENYLYSAIFATACCCLPTGIVAIVYAAQVNSKIAAGDYAGAQRSSDSAKLWYHISIGVGIVVLLIQLAMLGSGGLTERLRGMMPR